MGTRGRGADGSFVFADNEDVDFDRSANVNEFAVRASGGTRFETPVMVVTGMVQVGVGTIATPGAADAGTTRYVEEASASRLEMVMKTAAGTYTWVTIKENTW